MFSENLKSTAFIVGFLTFVAYIRQYLYYMAYNVDISNYITIEEVFTPFIDNLALYTSIILLCLIGSFLILRLPVFTKDYSESQTVKIEKVASCFFKIYKWAFLLMMAVFVAAIFYSNQLELQQQIPMVLTSILILIMCIVIYLHMFTNSNIGLLLNENPGNSLILFVLYFICLHSSTQLGYEFNNKPYQYKEVSYRFIKDDGFEILTDSNTIYLGRTKSNYFILRTKTKIVDVYRTSDILKESIIVKN